LLFLKKYSQTLVDIVNPGGTGNPNLDICAKFAPLPPRISLELKVLWVP